MVFRQEVREVLGLAGRGKSGKIGFVWLCFVPRHQVSTAAPSVQLDVSSCYIYGYAHLTF